LVDCEGIWENVEFESLIMFLYEPSCLKTSILLFCSSDFTSVLFLGSLLGAGYLQALWHSS